MKQFSGKGIRKLRTIPSVIWWNWGNPGKPQFDLFASRLETCFPRHDKSKVLDSNHWTTGSE
jgi:hypothetical protein